MWSVRRLVVVGHVGVHFFESRQIAKNKIMFH